MKKLLIALTCLTIYTGANAQITTENYLEYAKCTNTTCVEKLLLKEKYTLKEKFEGENSKSYYYSKNPTVNGNLKEYILFFYDDKGTTGLTVETFDKTLFDKTLKQFTDTGFKESNTDGYGITYYTSTKLPGYSVSTSAVPQGGGNTEYMVSISYSKP